MHFLVKTREMIFLNHLSGIILSNGIFKSIGSFLNMNHGREFLKNSKLIRVFR